MIRAFDALTGKHIYKSPLFIAVTGQRKSEISTEKAQLAYQKRYDIEPYFRFAKQRLLLERYQSPERTHIENWLLVVQLASWLLFAASKEVRFRPRKWERVPTDSLHAQCSIAQTRREAEGLFLTFDPSVFKPPRCKKGKGRSLGLTLTRRKYHGVCSKTTKRAIQSREYQKKQ